MVNHWLTTKMATD